MKYSLLIPFAIISAALAATSACLPAQDQPSSAQLAIQFFTNFQPIFSDKFHRGKWKGLFFQNSSTGRVVSRFGQSLAKVSGPRGL